MEKRAQVSSLPFAGKGEVYQPLPDTNENGAVTAHAVQTILVDPKALYDLWHNLIEQVPEMYGVWQKKQEGVTRIVIDPWQDTIAQPVIESRRAG